MLYSLSSDEGTPCPIGRSIAGEANIEKNGPTGARGASSGGGWMLFFDPFCTEGVSPTAKLVPRPTKRPKVSGSPRRSGCAKKQSFARIKLLCIKLREPRPGLSLTVRLYSNIPRPLSPSIQYGHHQQFNPTATFSKAKATTSPKLLP